MTTDVQRSTRQFGLTSFSSVVGDPQADNCKITFIVPVYNEEPRRVLQLIESLMSQDVEKGYIEALLVINNRPDDGSGEWAEAFQRNQAILNLPIFRNRALEASTVCTPELTAIRNELAVYAVDHSSPGNWVVDSNVGRARSHGLNETALRFHRRAHNGLVVHTDADCRFTDQSFVSKVLWLFREDLTLIGIAGVSSLELETDDPEAEGLANHLEQYRLFRRYRSLSKSVRNRMVDFDPEKTLGRCIVHRVFEGVLAGGIEPLSLAEDISFGNRLKEYAKQNGMHFEYGRRWGLGPVSALRISDRTPNSVRQSYLRHVGPDGQMHVEDVFTPGQVVQLTEGYLQQLVAAVRQLPGGPAQLEYLFITSPLANVRVQRS